jgi:hypothetical protein
MSETIRMRVFCLLQGLHRFVGRWALPGLPLLCENVAHADPVTVLQNVVQLCYG